MAYRGPCYCSKDVVPQFAIAHCSECVFRPGATPDVTVARDLEVLAYHMLYTKPWIGRKYAVAPALRAFFVRAVLPLFHRLTTTARPAAP